MRVWIKNRRKRGTFVIENVAAVMTIGDEIVLKTGTFEQFYYRFPRKNYEIYEVHYND